MKTGCRHCGLPDYTPICPSCVLDEQQAANKGADRSCRWYLADETGAVEAECCHPADHAGPHHVLFGYVPGSVALGLDGEPGTPVLGDADWQPPTGNPWSSHYEGLQ